MFEENRVYVSYNVKLQAKFHEPAKLNLIFSSRHYVTQKIIHIIETQINIIFLSEVEKHIQTN